MKIDFSPPDITQAEIDSVVETLKSGWITTGPKTKEFERELSKYCGTNKTACLSSATAALELTLRVLGIGEGDEVITSAYTYTASASVVCHVGAKLVLVDVEPDSFHLGCGEVEKAITKQTKAIIGVDIGGVMCDYAELKDLAESYRHKFNVANELQEKLGRIAIIADAAHSFGASCGEKKSGQAADFTCFSFHAVKNLTTGEGGAVTWVLPDNINAEDLYYEYMLLSLHGQSKDALAKTKSGMWEYDIVYPAYKFNMTDISAALGLSQLKRYNLLLDKRKKLIIQYDKMFEKTNFRPLEHNKGQYHSSGHLYMMNIEGFYKDKRNKLICEMGEIGVPLNVHYKPLPLMTAYKRLGFKIEKYPNAYRMYESEITVPLHTLLKIEQQTYITDHLLGYGK